MSTFNVCYLREYIDPENESETFNAYETIYRNVPIKYLKKFTDEKIKMKMLKFCDWNYKDSAANFTNVTNIEIIMEKDYYLSYFDVFGNVVDDDKDKKRMFNDYGQNWDRSSMRKDFNPSLTKSKLLHYNNEKTYDWTH
tara:strand:+ start:127 stop:543 length:417 start_codon:yes stop_codon:yes gene_type:complete